MMKDTPGYVILSTQRTGSSWLMDMLNNVEGIECHGELFLPGKSDPATAAGCCEYRWFAEQRMDHRGGIRPFSTFSYLDGLYRRPGVVGFKLMYDQLRGFPEIYPYLVLKRIRVIHLVRKNLLDIVISANVARASGRSHDFDGKKRTGDTRVHLDPEETVRYIGRLEKKERIASAVMKVTPLSRILVTYEELLADPERINNLAKFLSPGSSAGPPSSMLKKRQSRGHRESIKNYAEIEAALSAHGYGHYL
jgi:LPS sulfotransferase NodH